MDTATTSNSESGYVDLQVNGFDGVDFNAEVLDHGEVVRICHRLKAHGVAGILATVITDDIEAMCGKLRNIARVRETEPAVAEIIWGIHIEGPFLSEKPGYIGAHPASASRNADVDTMQRLLDAGGGLVKIVTLAPERDEVFRVTRMLADDGVTVSAGHSDASTDTLRGAIDAGLSMFTHLGNGCPLEMHRHDNIIQRALGLADSLWIGFIADGVHVPYVALRNYLTVAGFDRAFIVSDAISAAGRGPGNHRLGKREVIVDESLATWSADGHHLVGSATTLPVVAERLRSELGLSADEIERLMCINPRQAIEQSGS